MPVNVLNVAIHDGISTIKLVSDVDSEEQFTIKYKGMTEDKQLPQLRNLSDDVSDLTNLSHLNEASVLNSVKIRYAKREIYTYSGIVLVAVNPFDNIERLYNADKIEQYQNKPKADNPPHLFAIANDAYNVMKQNGESQSIIVSGESGAGKTVSAKYIMRFFANVNSTTASAKTIEIEKQILATNPIMEAFGNAKTTRNDNSSRFGKYLQIQFDKSDSICGANIKTYLLERSRLVYQQENERNYHIFYQMIKGLSSQAKSELSLKTARDYNYLYQGGTSLIDGVDDAADFKETCAALDLIGIGRDTQYEIFKVLAALLHIGNIKIDKSRDIGVIDSQDPNLLVACELLGLNPHEFGKWIVKKKIAARSDSIISNLKFHEAIVSRDSIAKYIYASLFSWICESINKDLSTSNPADVKNFIGVLDIYGFEHFDQNSFEQFCINYANEKLQQEFTQHVFKLQQEEYKDEGIEWSFIEFADNQPCIDLIESRAGILSLLDEQCQLPSGSEDAWADKMFQSLTQPPFAKVFKKARFGNEKFIVSHYALDVPYTISGFLEKNRDTVPDIQSETLNATTNKFLSSVLGVSHLADTRQNNGIGRRTKKPTLGSIFKSSLIELMNTINSTDVHYIRCIKPNDTKTPWDFENLMVLNQLRACGVLETIKISMVGFQAKCTFNEFLSRFAILAPDKLKLDVGKINTVDQKQLTTKILDTYINKNELYQMGRTKAFFKAGVLSQLEIIKTDKVRDSATIIQKYLRGGAARMRFKALRSSAVKIQSLFRGHICRVECDNKKSSIILLQSAWRGAYTRYELQNSVSTLNELKAILSGRTTRASVDVQFAAARKEAEAKKLKEERETEARRVSEKAEAQRVAEIAAAQAVPRTPSPTKSKNEELRKKSHRKGVLNFENFSQESLDEISNLPPLKMASPQSSHDDFSRKNTDTSQSDNSPVMPDKFEVQLTEKENVFFSSHKPEDALEIIVTNLINKMEKISRLIAQSEKNYEGDVNVTIHAKMKSDFERDVFVYKQALERVPYEDQDGEIDKPKNQKRFSQISKRSSLISSSSGLKFTEEESYRNYQVSVADLKTYIRGPSKMPQLLSALLLKDLKPPTEEEIEISTKNIMMPSRSVTEVLKAMWKSRMDGQSVIFLEAVVAKFKAATAEKTSFDEIISFGVYVLNNLSSISKFLSETRESLMYDLLSTKYGDSKRRSELMRLLLIMKRYFDAFFGVAYSEWMKAIVGEIQRRAFDAIVLDQNMITEKKPSLKFRQTFGRVHKYKMFDLVRIFSNVQHAMKVCIVDKKILDAVVTDMLHFVDLLVFNDLISRDNFLTYQMGVEIKYNLSLLIDWCHQNQIPDSPDALIHMLTLCQILLLNRQGLADSRTIASTCDCVSAAQVERITTECLILKGEEDRDRGESLRTTKYNIPLSTTSFENAFIIQR